jgi:hypothetical protein
MWIELYSNPVTLLNRMKTERHVWRRIWMTVVIAMLCLLAILTGISLFISLPALILIAYALLPIAFMLLGMSIAITTTHHALFWLLHLGTPIIVLTALMSGIGPLWSGGWLLSGVLGTPLLLGLLLSTACTVGFYNQAQQVLREQARMREGGQSVNFALPRYQNYARLLRIGIASGALVLAGLAQFLFWPTNPRDGVLIGLALLVFAGASLRVEATLRCWMGSPLVRIDDQGTYHATYAGRWALYVPTRSLRSLLVADLPAIHAGAALIALFSQGYLAPSIRRAVAQLSPEQAHRVALALSLHPEGTSTIQYLAQRVAPEVRDLALMYARLAEESTRPPDLRRWLNALPDHASSVKYAAHDPNFDLVRVVGMAKKALECYADDHILDAAAHALHQMIPALYGNAASPALVASGWPTALRDRIVAHTNTLRSTAQNEQL